MAVFSGGGTGGHLYPALTLATGLQEIRPAVHPFFVGARQGLESRILPEQGVDHLLLPVQGLRRGVFFSNLGVLWNLFRSLLLCGEIFHRLRPGLVVVTGGFAGGPAGLLAGVMGIPLALQEQNAEPGITTRLLSHWSRQIHVAFPEAVDRLPGRVRDRVRITGNPIRTPARREGVRAREGLGLKEAGPVILVVGGSQGSQALNQAVLGMIQGLSSGSLQGPGDLQILWATGPTHVAEIQGRVEEMGAPSWVHALGYIHDMPLALDAATLALSRAGAMTTSELLAWGLPAILVPLPTAAADHQTRNAQSLEKAGAAIHLPESSLDPETLWGALDSLLADPQRLRAMASAARTRGQPLATRIIAEALATLLPERERKAA